MSSPRLNPYLFVVILVIAAVILPLSVTAGTWSGQKSAYELILGKLEKADPKSMNLEQAQAFIDDLKSLAQTEALLPSSIYGSTATGGKRGESSAWEKRVAAQMASTGQMIGSTGTADAATILKGGQALLPDGSGEAQSWMQDKLRGVLPETDNKMAAGAMNAATGELARGTTNMASGLAMSQVGLSDKTNANNSLNQMALRSGLEGAKGAAAASPVYALNHMEVDYTLSGSGIDEYSALMVQPLWNNKDLHHNVFMQASYSNKDVTDTASDTGSRRDTVNTGLAYRWITPNEQHMFGVNSFFDHQWPYNHNRMSMGLDYKTSLYGVAINKYFGLTDWRDRSDGYQEKALGGEDVEFSGRLPQVPELEGFIKGYHWAQEKTDVINPDGRDIWGYQFAAEYTPINAFSIRSAISKDNEMNRAEGEITLRLNYTFGQGWDDLWSRPRYNLDSVVSRRFEKVRRTNEIRVQTRQNPNVTAQVTFAQGANVNVGQSLAFGTTVTTTSAAGNAATVVFGSGARLDIGQGTSVRLEKDKVVLISGLMQYTSGTGGITTIIVPNGTINLLGTDVDVRVSGSTTTLRVRDGAADFKDESGTTRVNKEQLAESQSGDSAAPQLRASGTAIYETHASEAHDQLDLVGPTPSNSKAAPYARADVSVSGTMSVGQTLTFTVPLSAAVTVSGAPQLAFTLGGQDRLADYASGSGTTSLTFTYTVVSADETLSTIIAQTIEKNGGTLTGTNGAPMILTVSGTSSGTVPDLVAPTISGLTVAASGGSPSGTNDVLTFTLDASETLVKSGNPTLTLDIGGVTRTATFASITSGNAIFTYTVQAGDSDTDGITVTALNIAANELTDGSGNDLDTTLTLPQNMSITITTLMGLSTCPSGDLSAPANSGCARLFGADPTSLNDVMVYAGDVPGTTTDFFVRRCDLGMTWNGTACTGTRSTMQWKDSLTQSATTDVLSGTAWDAVAAANGVTNTNLLLADASGVHAAANSCNALPGGGWYLPAVSEVDVMYKNLIGTDDIDHPLPTVNSDLDDDRSGTTGPLRSSFNTTGSYYWSSSEDGTNGAWVQRFSDGIQTGSYKTYTHYVRCARR